MTVKKASFGRFYEDFEVGDIYKHPLGRTITEADNVWFSLLTMNTHPMHFNRDYYEKTEYGRSLINSGLTVAITLGLSVIDVSQHAYANLAWDEIRLPNPLFVGDTLYAQSEVLEKRVSKSKKNVGIIRVRTTGFNQDRKKVIEWKRTVMVYRRGKGPKSK